MKPQEDYRNGDVGGGDDSEGEESQLEEELSWTDAGAPARALAALNALRKSRQHFDVLLVAGGAEVPAHRAVLAAASPYLLDMLAGPAPAQTGQAAPAYKVDDVEPDALKELVEYAYTGKITVRSVSSARRLYLAAWRLRVEPVRAALASRLARRLAPHDALAVRALPDLDEQHKAALDEYIAQNFEELCSTGALGSLPLIRIEMMRASSAEGGEETSVAVADAALCWLRGRHADTLEELCSRTHLLFVDSGGSLRECSGDGARRAGDKERQLGRGGDCSVIAARQLPSTVPRATRALLALRGRLALAHVCWTEDGGGRWGVGGVLGGGEAAGAERRAAMTRQRCAHGVATLRGRLLACGGYDRARVLQDAQAYDPATNTWTALPNMRSARARFPAARLGDAVYIVGGSDGHTELDSVDVFTPDGNWRSVSRLPLARSHAGAAAGEGGLYVLGGWAGGRSLKLVHKYDPESDTWSEEPPLTTARSQCAGVWWQSSLWALGGCDAWHCLSSTELLSEGAWRAGPALPTPRRSVGGAVWGGRLVSAGGSDGAASLRNTEWLEPGATSWSSGPTLRRARAALGLGVLGDALYAAGGFDGKDFLACVECLYDPNGEWTTLCTPPAVVRTPVTPRTAENFTPGGNDDKTQTENVVTPRTPGNLTPNTPMNDDKTEANNLTPTMPDANDTQKNFTPVVNDDKTPADLTPDVNDVQEGKKIQDTRDENKAENKESPQSSE